jgi:UDP-N-acetylglucosamine 2-epimerase (non-hydrolysing)
MIDSLFSQLKAARDKRSWKSLGLEAGSYGLVTLHRPEFVDDEARLQSTVTGLLRLAEAFPVVFPTHPRTQQRLVAAGLDKRLRQGGVLTVDPLSYLDFLGLESKARFAVTGSGGIQEETSAFGVPCFTLRDSTKRPITIELGTNTLLGAARERIAETPGELAEARPGEPIPLWDGQAGPRAAEALAQFLGAIETAGAARAGYPPPAST